MLKLWKALEAYFIHSRTQELDVGSQLVVPEPHTHTQENLSFTLQEEVNELAGDFADVYLPRPRRTHFMKHNIHLEPGSLVQKGHCQILEQLMSTLKRELHSMLQLWVTEEFYSEWCSPIMLVPKLHHSIWFCIDCSNINGVFKFDAHPTSPLHEMLDGLGKAPYNNI